MSLSILDSAPVPRDRPHEYGPHTADLNTTTDLHEENTTDLAPATEDVEQAAATPPQEPQEPQEKRGLARSLGAFSLGLPKSKAASRIAASSPPVPTPAPLAPGMVLADRYLLERVIGRGGTSIVFRARDMHSSTTSAPNAQIAVKTPKPEAPDRALAAQRLEHEYRVAKQLSHPGIVRMLDLHSDPERCFMTMDLIDGKLLSELLRERRSIAPATAHKILRSCADALGHAHAGGVVHGDFKPGNVFVLGDHSVRIVDFGAAIATPEVDPGSRVPAATAAYASPEVLGGQPPQIRDDVFSFACVAYELLAGEHPFEGKSSLEARAESRIPPRAWSLTAAQWLALLGALAWERDQRPADIETLMTALTVEPEPATARSRVPFADSPRELRPDLMPKQRSWGFFVFVACALVVTYYFANQTVTDSEELPPVAAPTRTVAADPLSIEPAAPATSSLAGSAALSGRGASIFAPEPERSTKTSAGSAPEVKSAPAEARKAPAPAPKAGPLSEISFESTSIVTSESSVAAVFLVKRSQPLNGRVRVQWSAQSGSADAGIDFASEASGTIEFADGQAQRAIYVPLRNDLIKEPDETFTVRLKSPKQARLGSASTAQATIRDDD